MTTSAESPNDTEPLKPYVENMDPSDDPVVEGHGPGDRPPFPPVWAGDPYIGHNRSCAVRVKAPCTCGMWELEQPGPPESPDTPTPTGRRSTATCVIAGRYLSQLLHFPPDVHIVGVHFERVFAMDDINITLVLEAFSDNEFPSAQVTGLYHDHHDILTGRREVIFDGWEDVS